MATLNAALQLRDSRKTSAAFHQRREPRVEKLLHSDCRLIFKPCVCLTTDDVTVAVDKGRHGRHAFGIDFSQPLGCRSHTKRFDASAADDNVAAFNHPVVVNDPGVPYQKVLCGKIPGTAQTQKQRKTDQGK